MARNEEKQQGKLNRLWLQREREEGRLKDVHERRPKLSTLNSASCVKKWIPSIKREMEYYLQQLQLPHYPERKIAEFQLHIDTLEREHRSFMAKLRAVDPGCRHQAWTPRAYCRRRDAGEPAAALPRPPPAQTASHDGAGCGTGSLKPLAPESWEAVFVDQDQPLLLDRTKLALRAPPLRRGAAGTQSLASVLRRRLPNLCNAPGGQTPPPQGRDADGGAAERNPGKPPVTGSTHVLGLDCYSSSDEEQDC
ncbi:uncharacterized protein si:dkey-86e18.1 isoform X1 [Pungitius pungitius]|uniref:uncharacterized protein si:dkey-86e18.1 isoform X1 n=1 Tax=Pungitius pungitius TaxID=134920 RepID=UPI0018891B24|nr:uncharacterized protein si:dkey-86e18.1 isoform X1 [Pungitius pungitius]